jgi:tetratricopeptide (TPR) repeat protein
VLATFRGTEPETAGSAAVRRVAGDLEKHELLERVELESLPRADAEALARVALSTAGAKIRTRPAALAELSEGHPLFMLELTRSLLEAPDDPDLPETLTSTIRTRVERASEYGRRVLALAVVFGEPVSATVLARASGVEPTDEALITAIEELVARRLLREESAATARYTVSHGLIASSVYRALSGARRRALHARAAASLESLEEAASAVTVESMIRHYRLAGELVRAAEKSTEAAERAVALAEPETAVALYRKAGDLYSRAGRPLEAANAWEAAGDVGTYACAMAGAGDSFSAALAIVETGVGDTRFRARLHRKLAEAHTRWGYGGLRRWEGASMHIEKGMDLTDDDATEEWSRLLAARSFLRSVCMGDENPHLDPESGEDDARQALRLAGGSTRAWLQAMDALVAYLVYAGRLDEALALSLERVPVATKLGDAHELHDAWRMAAYTSRLLGDPVAMERYARLSEEAAVPAGLDHSVRHSSTIRADALCLQERWDEAVEVLEAIFADPRVTEDLPYVTPVRRLLAALARAHLGELDSARALIAEAEADEGYDTSAFFGWTVDVRKRARMALKAAERVTETVPAGPPSEETL